MNLQSFQPFYYIAVEGNPTGFLGKVIPLQASSWLQPTLRQGIEPGGHPIKKKSKR